MKKIKMLTEHKGKKITRVYDKAYGDAKERAKTIELAEEMLAASAVYEKENEG
jgi:hypothetical protein